MRGLCRWGKVHCLNVTVQVPSTRGIIHFKLYTLRQSYPVITDHNPHTAVMKLQRYTMFHAEYEMHPKFPYFKQSIRGIIEVMPRAGFRCEGINRRAALIMASFR